MKEEKKKGDKGRGRDIGLYKQTDEATTGIFDPHPVSGKQDKLRYLL
jgi:hypothetical protein